MSDHTQRAFEAGQRIAKAEQEGRSPSYKAINPFEQQSQEQADAWNNGYYNPEIDYADL